MTDHALTVLAAIVPGGVERLLHATEHLEDEHFTKTSHRKVFVLLRGYYERHGGIMTGDALRDMLAREGVPSSEVAGLGALYEHLGEIEVEDHEFSYSVEALKDSRARELTLRAIAKAGAMARSRADVEGDQPRGHQQARAYLYERLPELDHLERTAPMLDGDLRGAEDAFFKDYIAARDGTRQVVQTGLDGLDQEIGGVGAGDLVLICGYAGVGKSMMVTQMAWHAAVLQRKNVFFATVETVRPVVARRVLARHSLLPMFGESGLDLSRLKRGKLPEAEVRDLFIPVVRDFTTPEKYGCLWVSQVPGGAGLGYVEARARRAASKFRFDLIIIDYLALLTADRPRGRAYEGHQDILRAAKGFAVSFNGGEGVPLVSPWAMNRSSFERAKQTGQYELGGLAETAEAEKSADTILSLLPLDSPDAIRLQVLKNRDGEVPEAMTLDTDFRSCYLATRAPARSLEAILTSDSL